MNVVVHQQHLVWLAAPRSPDHADSTVDVISVATSKQTHAETQEKLCDSDTAEKFASQRGVNWRISG